MQYKSEPQGTQPPASAESVEARPGTKVWIRTRCDECGSGLEAFSSEAAMHAAGGAYCSRVYVAVVDGPEVDPS
jgi:hypothetical protein